VCCGARAGAWCNDAVLQGLEAGSHLQGRWSWPLCWRNCSAAASNSAAKLSPSWAAVCDYHGRSLEGMGGAADIAIRHERLIASVSRLAASLSSPRSNAMMPRPSRLWATPIVTPARRSNRSASAAICSAASRSALRSDATKRDQPSPDSAGMIRLPAQPPGNLDLRRRPSWSPRSRTSTVCVGVHVVRQWSRAMSGRSAVCALSIACGAGLRH
jgi:hypothetical protein